MALVQLAEVSKIRPDGLPMFLIQNMPPEISVRGLSLTRPEIYYGEVEHEPVSGANVKNPTRFTVGSRPPAALGIGPPGP